MTSRKALTVFAAAMLAAIAIPALIGSCARRSPRTAGGAAPSGPSYGDCVIGDPIVDGTLAVYPVLNPKATSVDVLTFDEAVAKGFVTVTEHGAQSGEANGEQIAPQVVQGRNNDEGQSRRQENEPPRQTAAGQPAPQQEASQTVQQTRLCGQGGAQRINGQSGGQQLNVQSSGDAVNTLLIENRGDKPVFIMAGEIVKGGRQDRTIAQDSIIPPHSGPVDINVFCVEHGRWQGQSAQFTSANLCADNSVRQKALVMKGQSQVWQAVAEKNDKAAAQLASSRGNRTESSADAVIADPIPGSVEAGITLDGAETGTYLAGAANGRIQKRLDERLAKILTRLNEEKHVTGFVVAMNGTVVGADLFANPSLCAKMQEKLLKSYVYDAETSDTTAGTKAPTALAVSQLLNDVAAGKATIERNSRYGLNRANENDVAAIYFVQDGENGARLHECLQRK